MTTCEQIYTILKNPEREKLKIEFKTSCTLKTGDGQRKLGYEIVAFANRHGGKLIFGINDDGTFEGKKIFNVDNDKGIIDNICHTAISPSIDYFIEYLEFGEGDLLIINIQKRKSIPHAYIIKRDGPEIKNRIYYIRTEHGKRLVNDIQLDWLFKNLEDPKIFFPFQSVVHFPSGNTDRYNSVPQPASNLDYMDLLRHIPENEKKNLKNNTNHLLAFIVQISPYALLHLLSKYFQKSWLIQIQRRKNNTYWRSADKIDDLKRITINELTPPLDKSTNPTQSWDFISLLKNSTFSTIGLPKKTEITVEFLNSTSFLNLHHPDFNFDIYFSGSSAGPGLYRGHPFHENTHPMNEIIYPVSHDTWSRHHKLSGLFRYVELECVFNATFEFPENDFESFQYYYNFGENLQNILKNDWDFGTFSQKYPSPEIYSIDNKLTEVLNILNNSKKGSE